MLKWFIKKVWTNPKVIKFDASHEYTWEETFDGFQATTPEESTIRVCEDTSVVIITEQIRGHEKPICRGVLTQLPGGTWLADETTSRKIMSALHGRFVRRWGEYRVLGEADTDDTVCRRTYEALISLQKRLEKATLLRTREDGKHLYRMPVKQSYVFLEIDPTQLPFGQAVI